MSGVLTTFGATQLLSGTPLPQTYWAKGHVGNPGSNGTANPAAETDRIEVVLGTAVAGVVANTGDYWITGAAATESWTYLSLWDDITGGDAWWVITLAASTPVAPGNNLYIRDATVSLTLEVWV